jgi:hypothetical protein
MRFLEAIAETPEDFGWLLLDVTVLTGGGTRPDAIYPLANDACMILPARSLQKPT